MNKSNAYSQGLCIKRLCSKEKSLINHLKYLSSWFCKRGYQESTAEEQLKRVENRISDELLCKNSCVGTETGVPLIVCYHPHLNGLNTKKS